MPVRKTYAGAVTTEFRAAPRQVKTLIACPESPPRRNCPFWPGDSIVRVPEWKLNRKSTHHTKSLNLWLPSYPFPSEKARSKLTA